MNDYRYISLQDLEAYKLSRKYSREGLGIYKNMDWQTKKILGDQMITSVDSIGANIAEGYGRYHYLDKNKFYYNARASLFESEHWFDLLNERMIITKEKRLECSYLSQHILACTNGLIRSQYTQKQK